VQCSIPERGSESFGLLASPVTFHRCRSGLRSFSPLVLAAARRRWRVNLSLPVGQPESQPPLSAPHAPWNHRSGPSLEYPRIVPLLRHPSSSSTPRLRRVLRRVDATRRACSVRVVSHHLDGLLRTDGRRFVAPCCQTWGSPRFQRLTAAQSEDQSDKCDAFPTA